MYLPQKPVKPDNSPGGLFKRKMERLYGKAIRHGLLYGETTYRNVGTAADPIWEPIDQERISMGTDTEQQPALPWITAIMAIVWIPLCLVVLTIGGCWTRGYWLHKGVDPDPMDPYPYRTPYEVHQMEQERLQQNEQAARMEQS